jgi:SAM-dependent methyltransferase
VSERVGRHDVGTEETARANRRWWDGEADDYYAEHGAFLGDREFVWGPEGWTEQQLQVLRARAGETVLEIGSGAAQCSRWLTEQGGLRVVATDLSGGMLRVARAIDLRHGRRTPLAQCDAFLLPFADAAFDAVFTAYGVVPFVADSAGLLREVGRVLRPGGRFVFATTHPLRWALPDDPGPHGLTVTQSYFDRTPYVEADAAGRATYVEHHRTLGDRVSEITGAGLVLEELLEPEWPADNETSWGGWSPLRGQLIPGTAIFRVRKPPAG